MLGVLSVSPRPAQAALDTLKPEAQAAMDRGLAAAKQQEWGLAKKYFGEAQESAEYDPKVLFNLALSWDRGGAAELMAIAYYRAYLAIAPGAGNTQQVRQRIVELDIAAEANVLKLVSKIKSLVGKMPKDGYGQPGEG